MAHFLVDEYLEQKKAGWLKLRVKKSDDEQSIAQVMAEADSKFDPEAWLPLAAETAGRIRFSTHPVTFSHPGAKRSGNDDTSVIVHKCTYAPDGYWRSGNANAGHDAVVSAAELPVHGFLMLTLDDGRTVMEHIIENTAQCRDVLTIKSVDVDTLRDGFLKAVVEKQSDAVSSSKIKQVYFPVGLDDYHLLSVLTPSSLVYETRARIEALMFSEDAKEARANKKAGLYSEHGFSEFNALTVAVYGGDNPQNISAFNAKGNGKTLLLSSMPPKLASKHVKLPSVDFFGEVLTYKAFKARFVEFHELILRGANMARSEFIAHRDDSIAKYMLDIVEHVYTIREGSVNADFGDHLPFWQKVWLGGDMADARRLSDGWLDNVIDACAAWFVAEYERRVDDALAFGAAEAAEIKKVIGAFVIESEELFL